jgi:hypothetical protein
VTGWRTGIALSALAVAGAAVAPAFGAPEAATTRVVRRAPAPSASFGTFTPAAADPRLAAMFARSGLDGDAFRFTPAETRRASQAVTVAVRSRSTRTAAPAAIERPLSTGPTTVGLAPVAYNLGVAVGWRSFAIAGDLAHVDLAGQPGSRETADVGVSYSLHRFTGRVKGAVDRPLSGAPRLTDEPAGVSLDVGGSYSLTRNLDLTAGVRYRAERDRLQQIDDRRDSQAFYVGTAFRF